MKSIGFRIFVYNYGNQIKEFYNKQVLSRKKNFFDVGDPMCQFFSDPQGVYSSQPENPRMLYTLMDRYLISPVQVNYKLLEMKMDTLFIIKKEIDGRTSVLCQCVFEYVKSKYEIGRIFNDCGFQIYDTPVDQYPTLLGINLDQDKMIAERLEMERNVRPK